MTLKQMVRSSLGRPIFQHNMWFHLAPPTWPTCWPWSKITKPDPFRNRTHELGQYYGIRVGGRLLAMAGERLSPVGYTEISAVCTHPDYRGRGYGRDLSKRSRGCTYGLRMPCPAARGQHRMVERCCRILLELLE